MSYMKYATNPMKGNYPPMDEMVRFIMNPTPAEIAEFNRKREAQAKLMRAALKKWK